MPSGRVSGIGVFQEHLRYALRHLDDLLLFYWQKRWRRLRFASYIGKQKAFETVCQRITQNDPNTVVFFGDGRFSSSSRGCAAGPVKSLYHQLRRRCLDESGLVYLAIIKIKMKYLVFIQGVFCGRVGT